MMMQTMKKLSMLMMIIIFIVVPVNAATNICKKGEKPVPKEGYKFVINGCGPQGLQVKEDFGLYKCCNRHDLCYGTCGTTFNKCENSFEKCLKDVCNEDSNSHQRKECQGQANGFTGMTRMFGHGLHENAQRESCVCVNANEAHDKHINIIQNFYERHNLSDDMKPSVEKIQELIHKYSKKIGSLYEKLYIKYHKISKDIVWDNISGEF